jgi:hypothetical protein
MNRAVLLLGAWFWFSPVLAAYHVFQIPHIAGFGWTTTITVYNEGDRSAMVRLRQWSLRGVASPETTSAVPVHANRVWSQPDLLVDGIASISTEEDQVRVKLSYQYGSRESKCELFVAPDAAGTQWLIPNSHAGIFSWFSIVAANFGRQTATLAMTAFKDGVEVKSASFPLKPGGKSVLSSTQLWDLECGELDAVMISADKPIPAPIAISEKYDQSRHLMIAGDRIDDAAIEKRFFVPHITGNPWVTEVAIYNSGESPATFSLHQFNDFGVEIHTIVRKLSPRSSCVLSTEKDRSLQENGSAMVTGRGALSVLLGYRHGESGSWHEFFARGDLSRRWLLPNSMEGGFDWFGIALQNPASSQINAFIRAFKNGSEVTNTLISISPHQKYAALSEQMLGLNPWDFDMVSVETSQPIPMPMSVTGNQAQERHLAFGGQALADPIKPRKWAFLFYNDADFADAYSPTWDFGLEAYSGPNLDVLILEDTVATPTSLYYVNPNRSLAALEAPKEKNMADPQTLYDFIMKAKMEFPAERYVLALYDHGLGWQGCCLDETGNDLLTMDEMQYAISRAGGVDITLFTAPCLMAELESVYELRDWTDVYVGSEDLSSYIWFGTIQFLRSTLEADPEISTQKLGGEIVRSITNSLPEIRSRFGLSNIDRYTMSAIDAKAVGRLGACLDAFSTAMLSHPEELRRRIDVIRDSVQNYDDYFSIDLYDFLEKYAALETRPEIRTLIRNAEESLEDCIIAEDHGPANPGSHGLSIYFPLPAQVEYQPLYSDSSHGLDFSADTAWPRLVRAYKGIR